MNSHNHMNVIMAPHQYQTIIFTLDLAGNAGKWIKHVNPRISLMK